MNYSETIKLIYQRKWLIFWLTVLGAVLVFDLAVIQAPQYKASFKVLVIQKQTTGQDIYSISKSAQYLCQVLREGIYSDNFFNKVIQSSDQIEITDFSSQLKERRKEWQRNIRVKIVRDLGVMEIDVLQPEKEKAEEITLAMANILEKEHQFYHGGGQNVEIKILDQPLVSQKPSTLRLWIGAVLGALIGFLAGLGIASLRKKSQEKFPF